MFEPAPNTIKSDGTSITEDGEFIEMGGWWLVAHVNLVVRGRLSGIVDRYEIGHASRDIWALDVSKVLLGNIAGSSTLRLARYPSDEIAAGVHDYQLPWDPGQEGIFFLVPNFGFDAVPDLYAALIGSVGVISDDLYYWSVQIPRAEEALAISTVRSPAQPTDVVVAIRTEVIADGQVEDVSPARELFGWAYQEIKLTGVVEVWRPAIEAPAEEGVPPALPSELSFVIPVLGDGVVSKGDNVRVMLRRAALPDPIGPTWLSVGGHDGLLDPGVPSAELASTMDENRGRRDEFILDARAHALQILRPIAAEAGRIPLISDPPPVVEPRDPSELYRSPLTVETSDAVIVFDRWFFALLDGMARVTVTSRDGEVLAQGMVEGPDAIMRELADNSFEFVDEDGEVVATLTQAELSEATNDAYQEFMEAPG
ncbi:MAG: hypothetical protein L0Z49_05520 [Actinobacteria bacterium]|nr:hypothetical protein [Actinomycetota bacterium]